MDQKGPDQPTVSAGHVAADLRCLGCRCDLRGLPAAASCPECAYPIASSLAGHRLPLDRRGRIRAALSCAGCGAALHRLASGGACPRCGHLLADSIRRYHLPHATSGWVEHLAGGSLLVLAAGVLYALLSGYDRLAAWYPPVDLDGHPLTRGIPLALRVNTAILAVLGTLLVTIRDPVTDELAERPTARLGLRYGLALAVLFGAAQQIWSAPLRVDLPHAVVLLVYLWGPRILCVLLPLALIRHLVALLRRIPQRRLARFGLLLFWCGLPLALLQWAWPFVSSSGLLARDPWGLWRAVLRAGRLAGYAVPPAYLAGLTLLLLANRALSRAAGQAARQAGGGVKSAAGSSG